MNAATLAHTQARALSSVLSPPLAHEDSRTRSANQSFPHSIASDAPPAPKSPGRCTLQRAQVVLCSGCCCGRTDKNRPGVPLDELKALWKLEKLGTTVQLSISGCLGPCAMANVAMLIFPDQTLWLGPLTHDIDYAVLAGWAIACRDAGSLSPLPLLLQRLVFQRFSLSPA